ncbi:MAG: hypothetical protein Kow0027_02270 [Saprospiraceae bacterium]
MIRLLTFLVFSTFLFACGKHDDGGGATLPTVTIDHLTRFEGNEDNTFDFSVRLSAASKEQVSVDYETEDRSAEAGEDYEATSGTLVFSPGETQKVVSVLVYGDTLKEGDEEFNLKLLNPVNCELSSSGAIGTIRNDDTYLPVDDQGYVTPDSYAGWNLVWRDEFNGTTIDPANWKHETGNHGWGNNELQYYTDRPDNSYISDGKLVIEAKKENFGGSQYTSARMISAGLQEFQYGRIDIRAKLPEGKGIWPALWMLGSDFWTTGWPNCGEIDIMEIVGHEPSTVHGTAHWGDFSGNHVSYGNSTTLSSGKFSDEFHVFTIIWDNEKIRWFLDDNLYNTLDITPSALSEFHQPFFFIFNIAVGGNWPGSPDGTTVFPQYMYVDYIRVFQQ